MNNHAIALLVLLSSASYGQNAHVLYGERSLDWDSHAIFFDRNGFLYPSYPIADSSLERTNGSLSLWYKDNVQAFFEIAGIYHCSFREVNDANCAILNDSITKAVTRYFNGVENSSFTFLIHGFRKPFRRINGDADSPSDFKTLTNAFQMHNHSNSKVIEVYWDAMYDCCFSASKKRNEPLFQIFEEAQQNAELVGENLKKVFLGIQKDTINIITHSLGAKVAVYSLFNMDFSNKSTPSNKQINICLIAPAIAPEMIDEHFWMRNSSVDFRKMDNYALYIVYNEKDFVLRKKDFSIGIFGPGPFKYGITTLGCNFKKAATKLNAELELNFPGSKVKLYDLTKVGKCHHIRCYSREDNLKEVFGDMQQ